MVCPIPSGDHKNITIMTYLIIHEVGYRKQITQQTANSVKFMIPNNFAIVR